MASAHVVPVEAVGGGGRVLDVSRTRALTEELLSRARELCGEVSSESPVQAIVLSLACKVGDVSLNWVDKVMEGGLERASLDELMASIPDIEERLQMIWDALPMLRKMKFLLLARTSIPDLDVTGDLALELFNILPDSRETFAALHLVAAAGLLLGEMAFFVSGSACSPGTLVVGSKRRAVSRGDGVLLEPLVRSISRYRKALVDGIDETASGERGSISATSELTERAVKLGKRLREYAGREGEGGSYAR